MSNKRKWLTCEGKGTQQMIKKIYSTDEHMDRLHLLLLLLHFLLKRYIKIWKTWEMEEADYITSNLLGEALRYHGREVKERLSADRVKMWRGGSLLVDGDIRPGMTSVNCITDSKNQTFLSCLYPQYSLLQKLNLWINLPILS